MPVPKRHIDGVESSCSRLPRKAPHSLWPELKAGRTRESRMPTTRGKVGLPRVAANALRQQLAQAEAQLASCRHKAEWLESALAAQRHARQVLEAAVAARYPEAIVNIRQVVRAILPRAATVLVVSKGDEGLLQLDGVRAWHFPRSDAGEYAGYYPATSAEAIEHLNHLITRGAQYLLFPQTAFWWFAHYRGLTAHLDRHHTQVWRGEHCTIYKLAGALSHAARLAQKVVTAERKPKSRPEASALARPVCEPGKTNPSTKSRRAGQCDLVCFPIIDWTYRFQRPQQLMSQFAGAGYRVFYLSHEFFRSGKPYLARRIAPNLLAVSLQGPGFTIRLNLMDDDTRDTLFASLTALCRDHSPGKTVALVQSAFWWPLVKLAAAAFHWPVVYDCLDYHPGFPGSHPMNVDQERQLVSQANLVIASSAMLAAEARRHNRNVVIARNACDYEHFAKVRSRKPGPHPVIGYYGAIAEWFDTDLVAELAERRRDWSFILVGSSIGARTDRLSQLPNVSLPGEKPYLEIPAWLELFDVAILPFVRTPLTEAANPVKAYEIFASGKPLVSVPLAEITPLVPLVRTASTAIEFEQMIMAELTRPDARLESKRRAFAKNNTWHHRFQQLAPELKQLFG
jgi:hypothetical protein